jgi:hypothetical protein
MTVGMKIEELKKLTADFKQYRKSLEKYAEKKVIPRVTNKNCG